MKKRNKWILSLALTLGIGMLAAGCGQSAGTTGGADETADTVESSAEDTTAKADAVMSDRHLMRIWCRGIGLLTGTVFLTGQKVRMENG